MLNQDLSRQSSLRASRSYLTKGKFTRNLSSRARPEKYTDEHISVWEYGFDSDDDHSSSQDQASRPSPPANSSHVGSSRLHVAKDPHETQPEASEKEEARKYIESLKNEYKRKGFYQASSSDDSRNPTPDVIRESVPEVATKSNSPPPPRPEGPVDDLEEKDLKKSLYNVRYHLAKISHLVLKLEARAHKATKEAIQQTLDDTVKVNKDSSTGEELVQDVDYLAHDVWKRLFLVDREWRRAEHGPVASELNTTSGEIGKYTPISLHSRPGSNHSSGTTSTAEIKGNGRADNHQTPTVPFVFHPPIPSSSNPRLPTMTRIPETSYLSRSNTTGNITNTRKPPIVTLHPDYHLATWLQVERDLNQFSVKEDCYYTVRDLVSGREPEEWAKILRNECSSSSSSLPPLPLSYSNTHSGSATGNHRNDLSANREALEADLGWRFLDRVLRGERDRKTNWKTIDEIVEHLRILQNESEGRGGGGNGFDGLIEPWGRQMKEDLGAWKALERTWRGRKWKVPSTRGDFEEEEEEGQRKGKV